MKRITQKTLDAIMLVIPGPIGQGLSYREASEQLDLNVDHIMRVFQRDHKQASKQLQGMRASMKRQGRSLYKHMDIWDYESGIYRGDLKIVEIF